MNSPGFETVESSKRDPIFAELTFRWGGRTALSQRCGVSSPCNVGMCGLLEELQQIRPAAPTLTKRILNNKKGVPK